jgi:2-polyprenyl-3-methyl-5-hydroxy-6-metoxy-1,4-benzoquinol methylase
VSATGGGPGQSAADANRDFYEAASPGQADYWKKMAAPRFRVRTVLSVLQRHAPASVVDLGCGGGQLLAEVARALPQAKLVGVDLAEALLARNRAQSPAVRWVQANLDAPARWSEEDRGRYQAVTAVEVLEHVDQPAQLLANARALLAPGGLLVVTTQSGPLRETERRVGHRRHFTAAELQALLEGAGFAPEKVWNAGYPFHDLSKWYANLNAEGSMDRFSSKPYGLSEDLICLGLRGLFLLNSRRRGAQLFAVARAR